MLCIASVVFIHVPPWAEQIDVVANGVRPFDLIYYYVTELFSRSSLPLLGVISGFLLARKVDQRPYGPLLAARARTLLIPLLAWNAIYIACLRIWGGAEALPQGVFGWTDALLGLTRPPALAALYFVRDLILCVVLAPWLAKALRLAFWPFLLATLVFTVSDLDGPLFLSGSILSFFCFGLGIGLGFVKAPGWERWRVGVFAAFLTIPAIVAVLMIVFKVNPVALGPHSDKIMAWLVVAERIPGAAAFWLIARSLHGRTGAFVRRFEPLAFLVYCGHPILLAAAWKLLERAGVGFYSPLFWAFFALAPVLSFAAAALGARALGLVAPWLLALLTGGRVGAKAKPPEPQPGTTPQVEGQES